MVFKSRIRSKRYRPIFLGRKGAGKCPDQPGRFNPQTGVAFRRDKDDIRSGRFNAIITERYLDQNQKRNEKNG